MEMCRLPRHCHWKHRWRPGQALSLGGCFPRSQDRCVPRTEIPRASSFTQCLGLERLLFVRHAPWRVEGPKKKGRRAEGRKRASCPERRGSGRRASPAPPRPASFLLLETLAFCACAVLYRFQLALTSVILFGNHYNQRNGFYYSYFTRERSGAPDQLNHIPSDTAVSVGTRTQVSRRQIQGSLNLSKEENQFCFMTLVPRAHPAIKLKSRRAGLNFFFLSLSHGPFKLPFETQLSNAVIHLDVKRSVHGLTARKVRTIGKSRMRRMRMG